MEKLANILAAVLGGILAALAAFGILTWGTYQLLFIWFQHGAPNDPSVGDSVICAMLFTSPPLGLLWLILSGIIGVLTSIFDYRRLETPWG